jgi:type II secretory pathway component PulC
LAGLICLTGYFAFGERSDISSVTAAVSKIKFQDIEEKVITSFQDLAFYLDQVQTRDIFNEFEEPKPPPPVVKPVKPPPPPPPPPKVTIQEKAKNLKLMGISWGADPKVIIKNEGNQEVLFLEEGQKIEGTDIRVKEIKKDQVIISSEGDEMKLL